MYSRPRLSQILTETEWESSPWLASFMTFLFFSWSLFSSYPQPESLFAGYEELFKTARVVSNFLIYDETEPA